jgi:hypothetical protein
MPGQPLRRISSARAHAFSSPAGIKRLIVFLGLDVLIAMTIAMILVFNVFAHGISLPGPWQAHHSSRLVAQGTVTRVNLAPGRQTVTIRSTGNSLKSFAISPPHLLVTGDDIKLAAASVRPGDTLILRANGQIEDTSQHSLHLTGVVAVEPDADDGPMIVQVGQSYDVVVDITSATSIDGSPANTVTRASLGDADQVELQGVLDSTLGEMTQTAAIMRSGPGRAKPASSPPALSAQSSSG